MTPTDLDFRAVGYTALARNYPLSAAAVAVKSEYNGGTLPAAARYAPNAYCQQWWEWLAREREAGRDIWDQPGRLRLPQMGQ